MIEWLLLHPGAMLVTLLGAVVLAGLARAAGRLWLAARELRALERRRDPEPVIEHGGRLAERRASARRRGQRRRQG